MKSYVNKYLNNIYIINVWNIPSLKNNSHFEFLDVSRKIILLHIFHTPYVKDRNAYYFKKK